MKNRSIDSYIVSKGRNNNLDIFRFTLATLVVYSHSYWITGTEDGTESLRVMMFFIISGFFISASYNRLNNLKSYFKARALRIFPALILVVLLTVFLLGPLVTTLQAGDYLTNYQTYHYLKTLLLFDIQYDLPGLFENNPETLVVNGSIWTIYPEALYYIVVGILGFSKILNKQIVLFLFILTHILYFIQFPIGHLYIGFFRYFLAGMLFYQFKDKIPLHYSLFLLSGIGMYVGYLTEHFADFFVFFGTYMVFYFIYVPKIKLAFSRQLGNYSYGVFLFGYPIQQTIALLYGDGMTPLLNFVIAMPIAILCAFVSWNLVEKRALAMKDKPIKSIVPTFSFRKQWKKVG
ncbi:acyltransferase family protein [Guptibacillus hwajinpoensis]|uniref:acyltransferase family protein n=1 Tax=Guptibacillus hwajinpoensis TaxID=208199 RepID=UPI003CFF8198